MCDGGVMVVVVLEAREPVGCVSDPPGPLALPLVLPALPSLPHSRPEGGHSVQKISIQKSV